MGPHQLEAQLERMRENIIISLLGFGCAFEEMVMLEPRKQTETSSSQDERSMEVWCVRPFSPVESAVGQAQGMCPVVVVLLVEETLQRRGRA